MLRERTKSPIKKQEEKSIGELLRDRCENHTDVSAQSPVPKDTQEKRLQITSFLWGFVLGFGFFLGSIPHG